MPENSRRRITINAFETDSSGNCTDKPIPDVRVSAYDPAKKDTVDKEITDNSGISYLEFDAPNVGQEFNIVSRYNKICNGVNVTDERSFLLYPCCKDTTIKLCLDPRCPPIMECGSLKDTIIYWNFTDDNSDVIYQTTTDKFIPIKNPFVQRNNKDIPINVTWLSPDSDYNPPFQMTSPKVSQIKKNEVLKIDMQINKKQAIGDYKKELKVKLDCVDEQGVGHTAIITIILTAKIEKVECNCTIDLFDINTGAKKIKTPISKEDVSISVGTTKPFDSLLILTNNLEGCTIQVDSIVYFNNPGEWTIVKWTKGLVNYGESIYFDASFKPTDPNMKPQYIAVYYHYDGTSNSCAFFVELKAKGCVNVCPTFDNVAFDGTEHNIRISNDGETGFLFTKDIVCSKDSSYKAIDYKISYPANACFNPAVFTITATDVESAKLASRFFKINGTSISSSSISSTLNSGQSLNLTVSFKAPTIKQFEDIFTNKERNQTFTIDDSTFTIYISIKSNVPGCLDQKLKISAVLTTVPRISGYLNISAYYQKSDKSSEPQYQVCWFEGISGDVVSEYVSTLKNPNTGIGPWPPDKGDFYIDVADNSAGITTPREPILKLTNIAMSSGTFNCVKFWRTMSNDAFNNTKAVITQLSNDFNSTFLDFTINCNQSVGGNPASTDPNQRLFDPNGGTNDLNVYVFWSDSKGARGIPCNIGLLIVRGAQYGRETNGFHLSGIDFRVIYPVIF
jgi:hypothetical protein